MRPSKSLLALASIVATAFLADASLSGEGVDHRSVVRHIFDVADTDGSGTLTPEEYTASELDRYGVSFEQCDADGDGETSLAEYLDLYDRHHPDPDGVSL